MVHNRCQKCGAFSRLCTRRFGATVCCFTSYRPQRRCGMVIFSQACVKNSVHRVGGVCLSACSDTPLLGRQPPWTHRPLDRHPPPGQTAPPPSSWLLQQTVRILLECILVKRLNWISTLPCPVLNFAVVVRLWLLKSLQHHGLLIVAQSP